MIAQPRHRIIKHLCAAFIVMLLTIGVQRSSVAVAGTKLDRALVATLTPKARGPGWVRFTNRYVFEGVRGMRPDESVQEGACGSATIGGLWIAPETMAKLRPGQIIERNDLVGTTVTVSAVIHNTVTLTETGPLHQVDNTYDAKTGILSAITLTQPIGLAKITHSLQRVG